jgi:hypothetical protein
MKLRKRLIVDEPVETIEEKPVEKKVTKLKAIPKPKPEPKLKVEPKLKPQPKLKPEPKKNIKEISIDDLFQKNKKVVDDVDTEYESE